MQLVPRSRAKSRPVADAPRHCEAYPSLAIDTAAVRWRAGTRFCEWSDEQGGLAAQLDLQHYSTTELLVLYSCGADTYRHQRGLHLPVIMVQQPSGQYKPRTRCGSCGHPADRVFYHRQRWACQACQGLVARRSLLNPQEKLIVAREKLTAQVHAPAKPIRSPAAHDRQRFQLQSVMKDLGSKAPRHLPVPLRHVLTSVWFGDEAERTDREPHDVAPAYLDLPAAAPAVPEAR